MKSKQILKTPSPHLPLLPAPNFTLIFSTFPAASAVQWDRGQGLLETCCLSCSFLLRWSTPCTLPVFQCSASHRRQTCMNFSNLDPSHRLASCVVQSFRNALLQSGLPVESHVLLPCGLHFPLLHRSCLEPAPMQACYQYWPSDTDLVPCEPPKGCRLTAAPGWSWHQWSTSCPSCSDLSVCRAAALTSHALTSFFGWNHHCAELSALHNYIITPKAEMLLPLLLSLALASSQSFKEL